MTARELLSLVPFAVYVGITTIQCHYQGALRFVLTMTSGLALGLWAYLFTRNIRERRDK